MMKMGKQETARHTGRDPLREAAVETGAALLAAVTVLGFALARPGAAAADGTGGTEAFSALPVFAPTEAVPASAAEAPTEAPGTNTAAPGTETALPFPLPTDTAVSPDTDEGTGGANGAAAPVFGSAVASPHALLYDLTEGRVIRERDADARINPASLTKIMTLLVVRERLPDLSGTFVVTEEIVAHVEKNGGSNVDLRAGEAVTLRDLVYAMMLPSACDAAECLACAAAGSEENFAALMNEKAASLGLADTHFVNSSGLSAADHYSTVRDMTVILARALEDDFISTVMCTETYTMAATSHHTARRIRSSMFRLTETYTGARTMRGATLLGGKTGTGANQWRCLASAALGDDGRYYLLVTCGATSARQLIDDTYFIYSNYLP